MDLERMLMVLMGLKTMLIDLTKDLMVYIGSDMLKAYDSGFGEVPDGIWNVFKP